MQPLKAFELGDGFTMVRGSDAPREGLVAEVDDGGNLVHFGFYAHGELEVGATIAPGEPRGHAVYRRIERSPECDDRAGGLPLGLSAEELFRVWLDGVIASVRVAASGRTSIFCSFCGKAQKEVKKIIAGPSVYICNECIALCNQILAEESPATPGP
jgi:hypothetical protein